MDYMDVKIIFYSFCIKLKSVLEAKVLLSFHLYSHLSPPLHSTNVNWGVLDIPI